MKYLIEIKQTLYRITANTICNEFHKVDDGYIHFYNTFSPNLEFASNIDNTLIITH